MGLEENALEKSASSGSGVVGANHDLENALQSSQTDSTLDEKNEIDITASSPPSLKARLGSGSERGRSKASAAADSQGRSRMDEQQAPRKEDPQYPEEDQTSTIPDDEALVDDVDLVYRFGKLRLRGEDDDLPQDWWFASTAIPLIAATIGPMANVMSIVALVTSWRNNVIDPRSEPSYEDTSVGYHDPHWCIALNIASLVCGFVGNLFLLFNFTKTVRYIIALPMTIILWYFATGLLTGITIAMNKYVPPGPNQIYSQGFWHAVIASCLYMFCSMILMVNMLGYFLGHYPQHFYLTDEQRNLILQTIMFFVWLAGGAAVFTRTNGMTYPDAVYFCDVTILTIGFGDFFPVNDVSRGLVFPYSVGGIIILGLMVSSIHKFAGEISQDNVIKKHLDRKRNTAYSRAVTTSVELEERRGAEAKLDLSTGHRPQISSPIDARQMYDQQGHRNNPVRIEPAQVPARSIAFNQNGNTVDDAEAEPRPERFLKHESHRGPMYKTIRVMTAPVRVPIQAMTMAIRRQPRKSKLILMKEEKDRFDAMRKIQHEANKFRKWFALTLSVTAFATLWCVGAVVFWQAEHATQQLSYFEALYFCYVSLLTIGYGDLAPRSNAGKPFFVVWSLIAVPTMTILISDMGDTVIDSFKQGTFRLADWTLLPKKGIYSAFMRKNPWLWNWLQRISASRRVKKGFKVGPEEDESRRIPTIEELAKVENCSDAELTRRLAFAIRHTADDLKHHNSKKYSYEQWVEFTRLIRFTTEGVANLEHDEEEHGVVEWDWIGEDSPMLSEQTETEWILDRLCESLLRLLERDTFTKKPEVEARDEAKFAEELTEEGLDIPRSSIDQQIAKEEQQEVQEDPVYRSIDDIIESPEDEEPIVRDQLQSRPGSERSVSPHSHHIVEPRRRGIGLFPELEVENAEGRVDEENEDYFPRRLSYESKGRRPSAQSRSNVRPSLDMHRRRSSMTSAGGSPSRLGIVSPGPTKRKGPFREFSSGGRGAVPARQAVRTLKHRIMVRK